MHGFIQRYFGDCIIDEESWREIHVVIFAYVYFKEYGRLYEIFREARDLKLVLHLFFCFFSRST